MIDSSGSGASGGTSRDRDESEESGESGASGESGEGGISKRSEIPSEEQKEGKISFICRFLFNVNVNYGHVGL